jgi:hypothetical protein
MHHSLVGALQKALREDRIVQLHFATQAELGALVPEPAKCHDNAQRWVADHPGWSVVEGWIAETDWLFVKHSVVADPHGSLVCVTLGPEGKHVGPFIVHQARWTKENFRELPPEIRKFFLSN